MTKQEQLDRRRYYSVLWFLVGYVVWWGSRTAQEIWPSLDASSFDIIVTGVSLIGWGVFVYYLVRIVRLCHGLSGREWRQLNDERIRQNQRASFVIGFWALLGTSGLVLLGATHLTTAAAAHLLLLVGIVASLGAFLYFESGGGRLTSNDETPEVAYE